MKGGALLFPSSPGALPPPCSTKGATLASTAEEETGGFGGAAGFDSGVGAGAGPGEGSLAGADRLLVRVVLSLHGLSWAGSIVAVAVSELVATEERASSARAAVYAASLRERGENRDTQTRHRGDCDRGRVTP